jgi:hypothetical protein
VRGVTRTTFRSERAASRCGGGTLLCTHTFTKKGDGLVEDIFKPCSRGQHHLFPPRRTGNAFFERASASTTPQHHTHGASANERADGGGRTFDSRPVLLPHTQGRASPNEDRGARLHAIQRSAREALDARHLPTALVSTTSRGQRRDSPGTRHLRGAQQSRGCGGATTAPLLQRRRGRAAGVVRRQKAREKCQRSSATRKVRPALFPPTVSLISRALKPTLTVYTLYPPLQRSHHEATYRWRSGRGGGWRRPTQDAHHPHRGDDDDESARKNSQRQQFRAQG